MTIFNTIRKITHYLNIESELETRDLIHEEILKGIVFKGTNLWILFFAIIIASVGLNTNSTAVIIGAMLISPLMGPINGIGYSIATYNFQLLRLSIKNLSFAVGISLLASTIYFAISPLSAAHSELFARTSPSIYDVLIALFGGLAGIVAICSKNKGNVIPGVAIATALMPPLCTAGYGLATRQFDFFLGAFFLFTINTVFIAIASVIISQALEFPINNWVDSEQRKKVKLWITSIITVILFPSIYFGHGLIQNEKFIERANKYIANISMVEDNYLLKNVINPKRNTISLVYGGKNLSEEQKDLITKKAEIFGLEHPKIEITQGLIFEAPDEKNNEAMILKAELFELKERLREKDSQIESMEKRKQIGKELLNEIRILYPQISTCVYAESAIFENSPDSKRSLSIVLFSLSKKLSKSEISKIKQWVQKRLQIESIKVFFELTN